MAEQRPSESPSRRPNILCVHHEFTLPVCQCPNKYRYRPLEDAAKWMRLLTLYPAIDDNNDTPLHASLWPVRRNEAPEFFPVSYTWGQEGATSSLWVDDLDAAEPGTAASRCIPIRPNLEKLLRQFRRRTAVLVLWVDALCINQDDIREKGFQVRHMDQVYRDRQIRIWLGGRSENSDVAIDFVEDWWPLYEKQQHSAVANFLKHEDTAYKWSALWDLIGRPWFTRRWIVQECVLSDHKHVYLGDRDFCWEHLISLVVVMGALGLDGALREESNTWNGVRHCSNELGYERYHDLPPMLDRIESLIRLNEAHMTFQRAEEANLTLEKLVDDFCGFSSQDPRDGIYAFLSLASDTRGSEWVPDYSPENSVRHVFAQATRHIIRQTKRLDIICRSDAEYFDHSWIPWFGPAVVHVEDGHSHAIHGYNKKSLTTFGQPLRAATLRLKLCCEATCDGCDARILGVRHKCESCENFDFCDDCIKKASTSHEADHNFCRIPPRFSPYHASVGTEVKIGPESEFTGLRDGRHLELQVGGWFVDTVSQVGSGIKMRRGLHSRSFAIDMSIMPNKEAVGPGGLSDGFLRAITGHRRLKTVRSADDVEEEEITYVSDMWMQAVRDALPQTSRGHHEISTSDSDLNMEIMSSISVVASGSRRYAKMAKSIGFVPRRTAPGDAICVLVGCSVPVVLRKVDSSRDEDGGSWTLIGECYIDGLMEGEFMEKVRRKSLEPTSIILE